MSRHRAVRNLDLDGELISQSIEHHAATLYAHRDNHGDRQRNSTTERSTMTTNTVRPPSAIRARRLAQIQTIHEAEQCNELSAGITPEQNRMPPSL